MPVSFVGAESLGQVATSTTFTIDVPSDAAAGDLAVIIIGQPETAPTPTWPTGFTDVAADPPASRTNATLVAAYKILEAGDISTGTLTTTFATFRPRSGGVAVWRGVADDDPLAGAVGSNFTAVATADVGTVTTTTNGALVIAALGIQSLTDRSIAAAGYTEAIDVQSNASGSGLSTWLGWDIQDEAGATGATTITWSGNYNGAGLRLAFESADDTPPPVTPGQIAVVGDSLTAQAPGPGTGDLEDRIEAVSDFVEARANGISGRFVWRAADTDGGTPAVIDNWSTGGYTPSDLVVALGTNDCMSSQSIYWLGAVNNLRAAIAADLPSVERIWWVNLAASPGRNAGGVDGVIGGNGNTVADYNGFLASTLDGDREKILDWNAHVKAVLTDDSYWAVDGIHMTLAGYTARNIWLANQFATSPWRLHDGTPVTPYAIIGGDYVPLGVTL